MGGKDLLSEIDRPEEIAGGFVVAGRDGAVLLGLGEEVLDQVACLIQMPVVIAQLLSGRVGRNDNPLAGLVGAGRSRPWAS